jgi:hypothetical protein
MNDEINKIREQFQEYIIRKDITLQAAAELVGWKTAASVFKFLNGQVKKPPLRRLYRIKLLIGMKRACR